MSPVRPDEAGAGSMALMRLRLVMAMLGKDLRQFKGKGALIALTVFLLLMGVFLFSMARSELDKRGVPPWTGDILGGETGVPQPFLEAEVEADVWVGPAPLEVTFTPHVRYAEGQVRYQWDLGDGGTSEQRGPVTHTFNEPGTYGCFLVVEDDLDEPVTTSRAWVLVMPPGDAPLQAVASVNRTEGEAPYSVALVAAAGGGVGPYTYHWDLGDGNTSSEATLAHVYGGDEAHHTINLTVTDSEGNVSGPHELQVEFGGEGEDFGLPFTLLDVVYGWAVLVTMLMVSVAFIAGYNHEMKKGTVRTLFCYPVGVLDVTVAKLLYAAVIGGVLSCIVFFLATAGIDKPSGEKTTIFLTGYLLSLATVAIGALAALGGTAVIRKMVLRPTTVAFLAVILSFVCTEALLGGIGWLLGWFTGMDPDLLVDRFSFAIAPSPYHLGGIALSASMGGPGTFPLSILVIPLLLIVAGAWLTSRVYPDVFEKE